MKHLWDYEHPYYCLRGNWFSKEADKIHDSWEEFYEYWNGADEDMNLVWRFDAKLNKDEKTFNIEIFRILQRKALLISCEIQNIPIIYEERVIDYLKPFWERMKDIWEGIYIQ